MNDVKICENTIENMKFELFVNENANGYQTIKISTNGAVKQGDIIAPVDYYTVISAIMFSDNLDAFISATNDIWGANTLENMINELFDVSNGL